MDTEQANGISAQGIEEETFRQKAGSYLMCFVGQCPLHGDCLRWLVGQYADPAPLALNAVNPRNPSVGGEQCVLFRKNRRVVMKRGFKHLYHDMPGHMEHSIRQQLIGTWGRKRYFEMRRGDRLVTPDEQDDMLRACRHYGWTGPIEYDDEVENWLW